MSLTVEGEERRLQQHPPNLLDFYCEARRAAMLKSSAQQSPSGTLQRPIQDWISQHYWFILSGMCVTCLLIALWGAVGLLSAGVTPEDKQQSQNAAPQPTELEPLVSPEPTSSPLSGEKLFAILVVSGFGSLAVTLILKAALMPPAKPPRRRPRPQAQKPRRSPPQPPRPQSQQVPSFDISHSAPSQSRLQPIAKLPRTQSRSPVPYQPEEVVAIVPADAVIALDDPTKASLADRLDIRQHRPLSYLMQTSPTPQRQPRRLKSLGK
ncbi:MAG: hypothetical protein SAJ12_15105 [Jaaginema sp. PMC 1079.18]|nr:hypothetical protein [Jaaginema sp. PMC 1080.18]MEC4852314.1 hypothetical protein [Jaaginema sp. PMC 1079.18]MEC4865353.1 hypothetical protein [Jaaginema sp. PMC 1078.18]